VGVECLFTCKGEKVVSRDEYRRRLLSVIKVMERHDIDCLLLNRKQNIKYLTGASNTCSWVFIKQDGRRIALVLESDYQEYKKQSIVEDIRVFRTEDPLKQFRGLIEDLELKENGLALEKRHLKYFQFEMIKKTFGSKVHLDFNGGYVAEEARMIKTSEEIKKIGEASQLAIAGMRIAKESAIKGITEEELARRVYSEMLKQGASGGTYLYVASDGRSSLAHAPPTGNKLDEGPVVVDIHAVYEGYHADMARTIFLDRYNSEQVSMYGYYQDRVCEATNAIEDGMTLVELRKLFRKSLTLKEDWIMLTGPLVHGVGVMNFELPTFADPYLKKGYPEKIEENMVLAMSNLGLCSKQGWGVRFEDTFLVTKDKPVILTGQD
jgi:Xaa-Pro dipeptidase